MQRFFLDQTAFSKDIIRIEDSEIIHQLTKVLRLKIGDKIICLDNSGFEYLVEIETLTPKIIAGKILESRQNQAESSLEVNLYQALPKQLERLEFVLQKGTEIGISAFYPLITERTEVPFLRKKDRLRKIIKEAAEQSGRGKLPLLNEEISLKNIFKNPPAGINLFPYELENINLKKTRDVFNQASLSRQPINVFIGPEGGFSKEEADSANGRGFQVFSLGSRILRTETAGLVVASRLIYNF